MNTTISWADADDDDYPEINPIPEIKSKQKTKEFADSLNHKNILIVPHKSRVYNQEKKKVETIVVNRELKIVDKSVYDSLLRLINSKFGAGYSERNSRINLTNDLLKMAYKSGTFEFVYPVVNIFIKGQNEHPIVRDCVNAGTRAWFEVVSKKFKVEPNAG